MYVCVTGGSLEVIEVYTVIKKETPTSFCILLQKIKLKHQHKVRSGFLELRNYGF